MTSPSHHFLRCTFVATIAILFLLSFSVAWSQGSSNAVEVTGEASVVIVEDFETGRSELHYWIVDLARNQQIRLHFANGAPKDFTTGKKFKVKGRGRPDNSVDVDSLTAMADGDVTGGETAGAPVATPETRKVLTLLVDFNDALVDNGSNNGISLQEAKDRMFNEPRNVADLYDKASLGTLTIPDDIDGDGNQEVYGPYKINYDYMDSSCSYTSWVSAARTAFEQATGRSYADYRHTLLIVPNYWDYPTIRDANGNPIGGRSCTWGGIAQLGCGTTCWAIGADAKSIFHGVLIHELGHNFTMHHASTDPDNNGTINSEYGDNSDNMGGSRIWAKFNAVHAAEMGWHDPVNYEIQTLIPASGSVHEFDLLAMDEEASEWPGLRAVKVARDAGSDYYLSYRLAEGAYSGVPSGYQGRLNIHYGRGSNRSYFVDSLLPGETFNDPHNNLIFNAISETTVDATQVMTVQVCKDTCSAIPAPSDLTATAGGRTSIQLNWSYEDNTAGFSLQHSADGNSWSDEAGYNGSDPFYTDDGLAPGSTHYYRVKAQVGAEESGWSSVANATTEADPPTAAFTWVADFTTVEFSDDSLNGDGSIDRWQWDFGDGSASTEPNPIHSYSSAGTYTVSLTVTDDNGKFDSIEESLTVQESPYAVYYALGESTAGGTSSGTYLDTHEQGGSFEALTERESGGKPSNRYSWLEHQWNFEVQAGLSAVLRWNAWYDNNSDADEFDFQYSVNGGGWTQLFTVSATSDSGTQSLTLPSGFGGSISLRVIDTDQTPGNRSTDTVYVDYLVIEVEKGTPPPSNPPAAPTGLVANLNAEVFNQVDLNWNDNSGNETGFRIERRVQGQSAWGFVTEVGADVGSYGDSGLAPGTTYEYRVFAFNADGDSAASNVDAATTGNFEGILLTISAEKVKGYQAPLLTWTGSENLLYIYAEGNETDPVAGPVASGWQDPKNTRKGGPYSYQVCETNRVLCSEWVEVAY